MNKLVGRERECQELKRAMESDRSEFVIVYGRRRFGKTFLVDQYYQGHYDFTFVGGHNLSRQRQLTSFARALKKLSGVKPDKFADWFDAFDALEEYLDSLDASRKKVVFIDEMPWIDTQKSDFVAALENFWNGWAARRSDIVFIASGSATSWMVDNLIETKEDYMHVLQAAFMSDLSPCMRQKSIFKENTASGTDTRHCSAI